MPTTSHTTQDLRGDREPDHLQRERHRQRWRLAGTGARRVSWPAMTGPAPAGEPLLAAVGRSGVPVPAGEAGQLGGIMAWPGPCDLAAPGTSAAALATAGGGW